MTEKKTNMEIESKSFLDGNLFKLDMFGSPIEKFHIWFVWYIEDKVLNPEYRVLLKTFSMNREKVEDSLKKISQRFEESSLGVWDLRRGKFHLMKKGADYAKFIP